LARGSSSAPAKGKTGMVSGRSMFFMIDLT
jgi:hypothetical protein